MSEPRTIKKYPNRRLYDTQESKYITLSVVRQLVVDGVDFVVREEPDGEDITRQILLQIISEQECGDQPLFTKELLAQMIRFYGGAFQSVFTDYLGKTVDMLTVQQQSYQDQMNEMFKTAGLGAVGEISKQNFEIWADMQKHMLGMYGIQSSKNDEEDVK